MNFFFSSKKSSGVSRNQEATDIQSGNNEEGGNQAQVSSAPHSTPVATDVGAEAAVWTALRLVAYHYEKLFCSPPHERAAPRSVGSSRLQFDPTDQSLGSSRRGPVSSPENNGGSASFQKNMWTYLEQLHLLEIAIQRGLEIRYAKREQRVRIQNESDPLDNLTDNTAPLDSAYPDEQQPSPAQRGTLFSEIVSTPFVAAEDGVPLGKVIADDDPHNYKNRQRQSGRMPSDRPRRNTSTAPVLQTVEEQVLALLAEDEPETSMPADKDSSSSSLSVSCSEEEMESKSDERDGWEDRDVDVSASWSIDVIVAAVEAGVQHCIFQESGLGLVAMEEAARDSAGIDLSFQFVRSGIPWTIVAQWAAIFALLLRRSHRHPSHNTSSSSYGAKGKMQYDSTAREEIIDSDEEEEEMQAVTAALQLALRPLVHRLWEFISSEIASYHKSMVNRWLYWGSSTGSKVSHSNSGAPPGSASSDPKSNSKSIQNAQSDLKEQQIMESTKATRLCAALTLIRTILSCIRVPLYNKDTSHSIGNPSGAGSSIPVPTRLPSHLPDCCRAAFFEALPWLLWATSYTLVPGNTNIKNRSLLLNYGVASSEVLTSEHLKLLRYGILAHVDETAAASISSSAPSNSASGVISLDPSASRNKHPSYGVSGAVVIASPIPLPAAAASSTQLQLLVPQYASTSSFSFNLSHPCVVRRAALKGIKLLIELGFVFQLSDTLKLFDAILASFGAQEPSFRALYHPQQSPTCTTEESTQWDAGETIGYLMAFIQTGRSECSMRDVRNIMEGLLNISKSSESDARSKHPGAADSADSANPALSDGSLIMLLSPATSSSHRHLQQQIGMHWGYLGNPRRPKDSLLISTKLLSTRGGVKEGHSDRQWLAISISTFLYTTSLPLSETVYISLVALCRSLFSAVKALYRGKPAVQLRNELCRVAEIVAEGVRLWAERLDDGPPTIVLLNGLHLVLSSVKVLRQEEPHLLLATLLALRYLLIPRLSCTNTVTKELLVSLVTLHREETLRCLQQRSIRVDKGEHNLKNIGSSAKKGNFDPLWSQTESCEMFADILGELIGWIVSRNGSLADRHWMQAALDKVSVESIRTPVSDGNAAGKSEDQGNLSGPSDTMQHLIELHRHLHRFFCLPEEALRTPETMFVLMRMTAHLGEGAMRLFEYDSFETESGQEKPSQAKKSAEMCIFLLSLTQLSFFFQAVVILFHNHYERLGFYRLVNDEKNSSTKQSDGLGQLPGSGQSQCKRTTMIKNLSPLHTHIRFLVFHYVKWFTTRFCPTTSLGTWDAAPKESSFFSEEATRTRSGVEDNLPLHEMFPTVWHYMSRRVVRWGLQALEVLLLYKVRKTSENLDQVEDTSVDYANMVLARAVSCSTVGSAAQTVVTSCEIENLLVTFLKRNAVSRQNSDSDRESKTLRYKMSYRCKCGVYDLVSSLWVQRHLYAISEGPYPSTPGESFHGSTSCCVQPLNDSAEKENDDQMMEQQSIGSTGRKIGEGVFYNRCEDPMVTAAVVCEALSDLEKLSLFGVALPIEFVNELPHFLQSRVWGFSRHEQVVVSDSNSSEDTRITIYQQAPEDETIKVETVETMSLIQLGLLSIRVGVEGMCELAREEIYDESDVSKRRFNMLEESFLQLMSMLQKTVQMDVSGKGEDKQDCSSSAKGGNTRAPVAPDLSSQHLKGFKKRIEFTSLAWNVLLLVSQVLDKVFSIKKKRDELKFKKNMYVRESMIRGRKPQRKNSYEADSPESIPSNQFNSESEDTNRRMSIENILKHEDLGFPLIEEVLSGVIDRTLYCRYRRLRELISEHAPLLYRVAHCWGQWTLDDRQQYIKYCHREMEKPSQHKRLDPHQCHTMRDLSPTTISLLSADVCSSLIVITGEQDTAARVFSETLSHMYPDEQGADISDSPGSTNSKESGNTSEKQPQTKKMQTFNFAEQEIRNEQSLAWGTWVVVRAFFKTPHLMKSSVSSSGKRISHILSVAFGALMNTSATNFSVKSGSPAVMSPICTILRNDILQEEHQQILMNSVSMLCQKIVTEHHEVLKRKYDRRQKNYFVKSLRNLLAEVHHEHDDSHKKAYFKLEAYLKGIAKRLQEEEDLEDREEESRSELTVFLWPTVESVLLSTSCPSPFLWINEQYRGMFRVLLEMFRTTHIALLPSPPLLRGGLSSTDENSSIADHPPTLRRKHESPSSRNILQGVGRVAYCLSRALHLLTLSPHLSPSNVSEPISSSSCIEDALEFHQLCTAENNGPVSDDESLKGRACDLDPLEEDALRATRISLSNGQHFSAFYYKYLFKMESDSFFPPLLQQPGDLQRQEDGMQQAVELSDRLSWHVFLRLYLFSASCGPLRSISAPFPQVGGVGGYLLHCVLSPVEIMLQDVLELPTPKPVKNPQVTVHLARFLSYLYERSAIFGSTNISKAAGLSTESNGSHSTTAGMRNASRTSFSGSNRGSGGRNSVSDAVYRGSSASPEGSKTPGNTWTPAPPIFPTPTTILCKPPNSGRNASGSANSPFCFPPFLLPAIPFVCPSPPLRGLCAIGNSMYGEDEEQIEWNSVISRVIENNVAARQIEALERKKKCRGRSSERPQDGTVLGEMRRSSMSLSNFAVTRSSATPASPSQPFSPLLPSLAKLLSKRINTSTTEATMVQASIRGFFDVRQVYSWAQLQALLKGRGSSRTEQCHVGWFSVSRGGVECHNSRSTGCTVSEQLEGPDQPVTSSSHTSAIAGHSHERRNNLSMSFSQQSVSSLGLNDAGNLMQPHQNNSGDSSFAPEEMSLNSSLQGMNPFPRNRESGSRMESDLWSQTDAEFYGNDEDEEVSSHVEKPRQHETTRAGSIVDAGKRGNISSALSRIKKNENSGLDYFLVSPGGKKMLLFYMDTFLDYENRKINSFQNKQAYLASNSSGEEKDFPIFDSKMSTTTVKIGVPPIVLLTLITAIDLNEDMPDRTTRARLCHLLLVVLDQFPARAEYECLQEKIREVQLYREKCDIQRKEEQHIEEAERVGWVKGQRSRHANIIREKPRPPYQKALRERLGLLEQRMVSVLEIVPQLLAAITNFSRRCVFHSGELSIYQYSKKRMMLERMASSSVVEYPDQQRFCTLLRIPFKHYCQQCETTIVSRFFNESNIITLWQSVAQSTFLSPSGAKRMIRALTIILHAEDKLQEKYRLFSTGAERTNMASLLLWSAGYFAKQKEETQSKITTLLYNSWNNLTLCNRSFLLDWRKNLEPLEVKYDEWCKVCESVRNTLLAQTESQSHLYHLFQRILYAVVKRLELQADKNSLERLRSNMKHFSMQQSPIEMQDYHSIPAVCGEVRKFIRDAEAEYDAPLFFPGYYDEEDHDNDIWWDASLLSSLEAFASLWISERKRAKGKQNIVKGNLKEVNTSSLSRWQMSTSLRDIVGASVVLLVTLVSKESCELTTKKSEGPNKSEYHPSLHPSSVCDRHRRCLQCINILIPLLSSRHQDLITELLFTYLRLSKPYTTEGASLLMGSLKGANTLPNLHRCTSSSSGSAPCSPPFHETAPPSPSIDYSHPPFDGTQGSVPISFSRDPKRDCFEGKVQRNALQSQSSELNMAPAMMKEDIWWSTIQLVSFRSPRISPVIVHEVLTLHIGENFSSLSHRFHNPTTPVMLFPLVLRATALAVVRSDIDSENSEIADKGHEGRLHLPIQQVASNLQRFLENLVEQLSVNEVLGLLCGSSDVSDIAESECFPSVITELLGIQEGDEQAVAAFLQREVRDQKRGGESSRQIHTGANDEQEKYLEKEKALLLARILVDGQRVQPHEKEAELDTIFYHSSPVVPSIMDNMERYWRAIYSNSSGSQTSDTVPESLCSSRSSLWYAASISPSAAVLTELALVGCDHRYHYIEKGKNVSLKSSSLMANQVVSVLRNENALSYNEETLKEKGIRHLVLGLTTVSHPFQLLYRLWGAPRSRSTDNSLSEADRRLIARKTDLEKKAFSVMRYCIHSGSATMLTIPCFELSDEVSAEWKLNLLSLLATATFEGSTIDNPSKQCNQKSNERNVNHIRLEPLVLFLMHRYLLDGGGQPPYQDTEKGCRLASFLRVFVFLLRHSGVVGVVKTVNPMVFNPSRLGTWISHYLVRFYFKEFPEEGKNVVRELSAEDNEILRRALRSSAEDIS